MTGSKRTSHEIFVTSFCIILYFETCSEKKNERYKKFISWTYVRILIKTADGKQGRLFFFDKGTLSSLFGDHETYDMALIRKDAASGFAVMKDKKPDASFNAAAEGKLKVEVMNVYAQRQMILG